jgi:hypothetical protein
MWTFKYSNGVPVAGEGGRAFQYDSCLVWQQHAVGDTTKVYSWDGVSEAAVEIFDSVSDIHSEMSETREFTCLLEYESDLYFSYALRISGETTFGILKYSGTPHSWDSVYSTEVSGSPIAISFTKAIGKMNFLFSSSAPSNTYVYSSDGNTWTSGTGIDYSVFGWLSQSIYGLRTEDSAVLVVDTSDVPYCLVENSGSWANTATLGTASSFAFMRNNGEVYRAIYCRSNSTYNVFRSTDLCTNLVDTGFNLTGYAFNQVYIFSAGGREFYGDTVSGDLYYFNGTEWARIEELPETYLFGVAYYGGKLYINSSDSAYSGASWYEHSTFNDWDPIEPVPSSTSLKLLSLSIPLCGGDSFWLTDWTSTGGGNLYLLEYSNAGEITRTISLGACTLEELEDTYVAYVFSLSDEKIFIFGRFNLPGGGLVHIVYSEDGGDTFEILANDWDTDICCTLLVDSDEIVYAIRSNATSSVLYTGIVSLFSQKQILPYNVNMTLKAIDLDSDKTLFLGAGGADSTMVIRVPLPYTDYQNLTVNHQNTQKINGIIKV